MYKEILEQSEVIERTLYGRLEASSDEIPIKLNEASKFEKIWIVACGTAYHAGLFGKDLFEKVLGVPVSVELASEFRYREPIVGKNDLGIVISQSGETMDTIAATELLKENGSHVLALVNVVGSSLARMADSVFYLHVGPEIGVASTKAYLGMLVSQLVIAKHWYAENKLDVSFDEIADSTFEGDVEKAKRAVGLFNAYCARCHTAGYSAGVAYTKEIASGGLGPALRAGRVNIQFKQREDFIDFIIKGSVNGKAYGVNGVGGGKMPGFGAVLPQSDIELIIDYLRGMEPDA